MSALRKERGKARPSLWDLLGICHKPFCRRNTKAIKPSSDKNGDFGFRHMSNPGIQITLIFIRLSNRIDEFC